MKNEFLIRRNFKSKPRENRRIASEEIEPGLVSKMKQIYLDQCKGARHRECEDGYHKTRKEVKITPSGRRTVDIGKRSSHDLIIRPNVNVSSPKYECLDDEMEVRFQNLKNRLDVGASGMPQNLRDFKASTGIFREREDFEMSTENTSPFDASISPSSDVMSALNFYKNTERRQRQVFIETISKNAKTSTKKLSALEQDTASLMLGVRDTNRRIVSGITPEIVESEFDFFESRPTPQNNLIIGRPRLATVDYKMGDRIRLTLHDSRETNRVIQPTCKHCHCCQSGTMLDVKDVGNKPPQTVPLLRNKNSVRHSPLSDNEVDPFSQLKKVSLQWKEIAKRHVPKSNKDFWDAIKNDETPRPSTRTSQHPGTAELEFTAGNSTATSTHHNNNLQSMPFPSSRWNNSPWENREYHSSLFRRREWDLNEMLQSRSRYFIDHFGNMANNRFS